MNPPMDGGDGRVDRPLPTPPPSAGVKLEVALLEADQAAPASVSSDGRPYPTVLVISDDADLRRHVRESLRDRTDVRVLGEATIDAAVALLTQLRSDGG